MNVGFIGLGHMGVLMSGRILAAGHDLIVHDLRREAAVGLLAAGARWATSPRQAGAGRDVVITMLPAPRDVEEVLLGRRGLLGGLPPGAVWIDMSTSVPAVANRVRAVAEAREIAVLDAPVSGMAAGARDGTLQIFVGGSAETYQRVRPLLQVMGDPERIIRVGPNGTGYTVKLMINLLWFAHLAATAEVLTVGVRAGVDLATTTAGTGAETNAFAVVTDPQTGRTFYVGHASSRPAAAILDPELTHGLPPTATAATGMDALTHALESSMSRRANPWSDGIARQVIRMAGAHLPRAVQDGADREARAQMILAAHLAGVGMDTTGLGVCHAIGHALGGRFGIPHGVALTMVLPAVLRFNRPACADRLADVAFALGAGDTSRWARGTQPIAPGGTPRLRSRRSPRSPRQPG